MLSLTILALSGKGSADKPAGPFVPMEKLSGQLRPASALPCATRWPVSERCPPIAGMTVRHCFRCSLQAFTLIELLVTIAIIALLLALIFPSFETILNEAAEVKCLSNVHNFGTAVLSAISDGNGRLAAPIVLNNKPDLNAFIAPYLNGQVLLCPRAFASSSGGLNYAINYNIWGDVLRDIPRQGGVMSISLPHSRVVLAAEECNSSQPWFWTYQDLDSTMWGCYTISPPSTAVKYAANPAEYHLNLGHRGLNMFMLDGSAALVCPTGGGGWGPGTETYGTPENSGYYYEYDQFY